MPSAGPTLHPRPLPQPPVLGVEIRYTSRKHLQARRTQRKPPLAPQTCAQVLLTLDNLANRGQYLNARNTFTELLAYGVIPVVNENVRGGVGRGMVERQAGGAGRGGAER